MAVTLFLGRRAGERDGGKLSASGRARASTAQRLDITSLLMNVRRRNQRPLTGKRQEQSRTFRFNSHTLANGAYHPPFWHQASISYTLLSQLQRLASTICSRAQRLSPNSRVPAYRTSTTPSKPSQPLNHPHQYDAKSPSPAASNSAPTSQARRSTTA